MGQVVGKQILYGSDPDLLAYLGSHSWLQDVYSEQHILRHVSACAHAQTGLCLRTYENKGFPLAILMFFSVQKLHAG